MNQRLPKTPFVCKCNVGMGYPHTSKDGGWRIQCDICDLKTADGLTEENAPKAWLDLGCSYDDRTHEEVEDAYVKERDGK